MASKSFVQSLQDFVPGSILQEIETINHPDNNPIRGYLSSLKSLGAGTYAHIFLAEEEGTKRRFAVRVSANSSWSNIASQIIFSNYEMSPKIFYNAIVQERKTELLYTISVMDLIYGSLKDLFWKKEINPEELGAAFKCLMDKAYLLKVLHGDAHMGNIVLLKDKKTLGFIDFDMTLFDAPPIVRLTDGITLIASLGKAYITYRDKRIKMLQEDMLRYYKKTFNVKFDLSRIGDNTTLGGGYGYKTSFTDRKKRVLFIHSYFIIQKYPQQLISDTFPDFQPPIITN